MYGKIWFPRFQNIGQNNKTNWTPSKGSQLDHGKWKRPYYKIKSVISQKIISQSDLTNTERKKVVLNDERDKESSIVTFINEGNFYLIKSKNNGYLTLSDDSDSAQIYFSQDKQERQKQLFEIFSRKAEQGFRIKTFCGKFLKIKSDEGLGNYEIFQGQKKLSKNELWQFDDIEGLLSDSEQQY